MRLAALMGVLLVALFVLLVVRKLLAGQTSSIKDAAINALAAGSCLGSLALAAGVLGGLAYAFRRRSTIPHRPASDVGRSAQDLQLEVAALDPVRLGRRFDWIAWAQLLTGGFLIGLNGLILIRGFDGSALDPMTHLVVLLTARDDVPTSGSPRWELGPLLLVGTALVASGLLALNRPEWSEGPLRFLHRLMVAGALLGVVRGGIGRLNPDQPDPWILLVGPCVLLAWTSYRFLRRLRSEFFEVQVETGRLRAPWTTGVVSAFCVLAAAYILIEGPGMPDQVIREPHERIPTWTRKIGFSPGGDILVSFLGAELVVLEPRSGRVLTKIHASYQNEVDAVAFSRDGRHLAWAALPGLRTSRDGVGRIWDDPHVVPPNVLLGGIQIWRLPERIEPETRGAPRDFLLHSQSSGCRCDPTALSFSPDGHVLMVGTEDGSVWKLDVATGDLAPAFKVQDVASGTPTYPARIDNLGFTRDGRSLAVLSRASEHRPWICTTWDAVTFDPKRSFSLPMSGPKKSAQLFPEADTVITYDATGRTFAWDVVTGVRRGPVGDPRCPWAPWSFTPAGDAAAISCGTRLEAFEFPSMKPLATAAPWHRWPLPVPPLLAFSEQGLVAGTEASYPADRRAIRLWRFAPPPSDRARGR